MERPSSASIFNICCVLQDWKGEKVPHIHTLASREIRIERWCRTGVGTDQGSGLIFNKVRRCGRRYVAWSGPCDERRSIAISLQERSVVAFASLQMFALIYLQKFALGGSSFPLPVPILILLLSPGWMILSLNLRFAAPRLASYLVFITWCLWSQSLSGGSLPSLAELVLLYGSMTLLASVSDTTYRQILDRFTILMTFPAYIIIVHHAYQKLTGLSDPISMDRMMPSLCCSRGFEAHYPWNSTFSRPNGLFFLEPSFASAFTASAAIIEITYFRRPYRLTLMIVATVLTMGATGISMLLIAAPFLLARRNPVSALWWR